LDEIELLARRFPERIRLFTAYRRDTLLAGAVLYVSDHVCHVQYNASSPDGRKLGAIDLLFGHIIDSFAQRLRYFDFGISTDRDGRFLNRGLVQYKQEFGARAVTHDFYRLRV
jgi:lipid II:glycine glycyltransferase (peptidoglycan interpeptide bridge formation enzyme)